VVRGEGVEYPSGSSQAGGGGWWYLVARASDADRERAYTVDQ